MVCKMVGQERLITKIEFLSIDTLPHSLMILGEKGSGRHTIFDMIVDKLHLPFFDITDKLSHDMIDEIYLQVEPIIYFIDIDGITIKESNMILKLVEEPLKNAFIVFIGRTRSGVLPTILNRCQIWEMEKYNEEQLKVFLTEEQYYLLDYCNTPGQILYLKHLDGGVVNSMQSMCEKIVAYVGSANFANTLTIGDKIAFKNEQDKWDYDVFIKILYKTIKRILSKNYSSSLNMMFTTTSALLKNSEITHINKRHLFENYLCECRYIMR